MNRVALAFQNQMKQGYILLGNVTLLILIEQVRRNNYPVKSSNILYEAQGIYHILELLGRNLHGMWWLRCQIQSSFCNLI